MPAIRSHVLVTALAALAAAGSYLTCTYVSTPDDELARARQFSPWVIEQQLIEPRQAA